MPTNLPRRPSLTSLRKQAKTLLKEVRAKSPEAEALVREHHPQLSDFILRDAQFVVARKYGYEGWSDLCEAVEEAVDSASTLESRADLFADLACLCYFGGDHIQRRQRAGRLLLDSPEIVSADVFAAAAAFDVDALAVHLAANAQRATASGGPRDWPPLLYVCYSRVPEDSGDAVEAARILLEAGAPGDTYIVAEELGGWRWAGLTGAMGEGEEGLLHQPPHARARELAELLLDRGADPNDAQGLYNTMFTPGNEWLELLLSRGLDATAVVEPGRNELKTLDYQLSQAVKSGLAERVSLLLKHGADPMARDSYNQRSNYENALLGGFPEIAAQLIASGARVVELTATERFMAAVMREDEAEASILLGADPQLINNPSLNMTAVNKLGATKLLLALGADPNTPVENGRVPLHEAAWANNVPMIEVLLAAGARSDVRESSHNATPVGFANHAGHFETRDLLLDHSQDVFDLAYFGRVEQLRRVLADDPSQVTASMPGGYTLMHRLPEEGYVCEDIVCVLVEFGADINAVAEDGATPLALALGREDDRLATILRSHGGK